MPNFMDEYLLKLGVAVDSAGLARFQTALREASSLVDHESVRMAGSFFKAQTEIVAGFAAIGGAAIGLADKVAMADQEYRLFAMHMYMSKDAARSLKVAMDALGQPLENLSWDPELRGRTRQLIADQRAMAPGEDFEKQMHKIRDIRFEFTRMEVELEYLGMHVVQDFMKMLGMGPDELLVKLEKFNAWVIANMPAISHALSTEFLPIWRDIEHVFTDVSHIAGGMAVVFTNLIGLLSGDTSIEGTAFSFDKLGEAIHHVADWMETFVGWVASAETLLMHMLNAMMLASSGNMKGAAAEFSAALHDLTPGSGAIGGAILGGISASIAGGTLGSAAGPLGTIVGAIGAVPIGMVVGAASGAGYGALREHFDPSKAEHENSRIEKYVKQLAGDYGVDPTALLSLVQSESGMRQYDKHGDLLHDYMGGSHVGAMQLSPDIAARYHAHADDAFSNIGGGTQYLRDLRNHYNGDYAKAIGAYAMGQSGMDAALAGRASLSDDARRDITNYLKSQGKSGDVQIGSVTIHVTQGPGEHAKEFADRVVSKLNDFKNKQVQRNLLEFQAQGTSY